jgi:hypothetical protein
MRTMLRVLLVALLAAACAASTMKQPGTVAVPVGPPGGSAHDAAHIGMTAHVTADTALPDSAIERVRRATAAFHDLDAAVRAGYPARVAQCVAHPQDGAMGFHHLNRELLDDRIELERPEILLYSRLTDSRYVLNGVEYIVPYSARSRDAAPPKVLGRSLKRADELEIWYLHVWLWTANPHGMFAEWNPNVSCAPQRAGSHPLPRRSAPSRKAAVDSPT